MNLLEIIFVWILYASLTSTMMIFCVILLKKLIKNHMDLRFYHALWLLVMIRLLIPFTPESPLSMFNLLPENHQHMIGYNQSIDSFYTLESEEISENEKSSDIAPIKRQTINKSNLPKEEILENKKKISFENSFSKISFQVASYIWCFGFLTIFLLIMFTAINFNKKAKKFKKVNDSQVIQILNLLKEKLKMNKNIELYYEERIKSPFIAGLIHPKIYLPRELLRMVGERELYYILLHELIHYKRKDLFYNLFETIALSLHWFNPVVWFAVKKMRFDRELSCDYGVLEILEEKEGTEYGLTILKLSSIFSNHISKKMIPAYFYENKNQIERRIMMIKTFKKSSYKISILVVLIFLLLTPLTLTNAQINTNNKTSFQNKGFSLDTPVHFNTLERALDFVNFDFKVPDTDLNNYIFDSIILHDDVLRIKFAVKNVVDTSAFTLTISKKELMEDEKKKSYEIYKGSHDEKITKKSTIEPMTIANTQGIRVTTKFNYEWTEKGIKELEKNNTKNTKHIPTIEHIEKYFIWQEDGIWYSLDYYFENNSYYGDTSMSEIPIKDMETILSSLRYTKELKNMDYVSKAWENYLYIYGDKDLRKAEKIIGFVPKFPLKLPEGFTAVSSSIGCPMYLETEPWTQLETLFQKEKDNSSEITFIQTKSIHRYGFLEKNGYDRETEIQAKIMNIEDTKMFTFEGKDKQYYMWKKDNIIYTVEFTGTFKRKENIVKFFINETPYFK
ncbi:M56 family metallopeptidase [Crassaminicella profunda]|uniref:M56 family metallopeptidase n=1 Tax=Crassaminicella profunda TaxID=1286698 RepID=UPI001CA7A9DF|nr:M56 family metallopeptidase [Crassaminicella profunda]QZY53989.1 M56 family metallopeptidase [Crassaminicella profunda]